MSSSKFFHFCFSDLRIPVPNDIIFHIQQVYVCCVLLVSNRLALNLYRFAKSPVLKQDCSFLLLQLIALLFLPHRLQPQILQNKSLGIHILCIAVPKPSGKKIRDAWQFGGKELWYFVYSVLLPGQSRYRAPGQRAVSLWTFALLLLWLIRATTFPLTSHILFSSPLTCLLTRSLQAFIYRENLNGSHKSGVEKEQCCILGVFAGFYWIYSFLWFSCILVMFTGCIDCGNSLGFNQCKVTGRRQ